MDSRRTQRVNLTMRDPEWRLVERALAVTYERPTEFVRLGAIARARCVLANPERFGGTAEMADPARDD